MPDLIPPHGGVSEPVNRQVPAEEQADFRARAASLPRLVVSDADLSTVFRLGDGGLSPLTGPMDRVTWERVLDHAYIEHQGTRYAWTIPLALPVTSALAATLDRGQTVQLTNGRGEAHSKL